MFPNASEEAIDFLTNTLVCRPFKTQSNVTLILALLQTFDPKKRMTVDQALEHPYLSAYASLISDLFFISALI
jgi:mitogen-activated protein kinase 1/3